MQQQWVPLVDYRRNGLSEVTIHGAISWFHGKKLHHSYGGNVCCYGRSMMKPVQIKVLQKELAPVLTPEQKAIAVSSHNSEGIHIEAVLGILSKNEWGLMQTPHALPLMQFGKQLRRPRRWYHTCSGEHAAILRGCQLKGWSRAGYVWPHHAFHKSYLEHAAQILGPSWKPKFIAKDGCGLPTVSYTVNELGQIFASLAIRKDEDWIWGAMVDYPDHVGGFNRLDSTILKSCGGQVIAKEGADGLLGLAIRHKDFPEGLGVVVKVAHGWNPQAMWYVARYVLGVLGFTLRNPYPLERQKAFIVPEVIPKQLRDRIADIVPWDSWDPDKDRWEYDPYRY